jgi:hypothetical protein
LERKLFIFKRHYLRAAACLLTKNEEKAKTAFRVQRTAFRTAARPRGGKSASEPVSGDSGDSHGKLNAETRRIEESRFFWLILFIFVLTFSIIGRNVVCVW